MFSSLTYLTGGFLSIFTPILTPLLLLLRLFGINYYTIRNDEERIRIVIKYLQKNTVSSQIIYQYGSSFPSGIFLGWNCVGHYHYFSQREGGTGEVYIICTKSAFSKIIEGPKIAPVFKQAENVSAPTKEDETFPLMIYGREGGYTNLYYSSMNLDLQGLEPKGKQKEIVDEICDIFDKTNRGVFFIHGVSGAGKSTIGLLVAKKLKGTFCHSFNPTEPGDNLHLLLRDTSPAEGSPTVIVLEEVNTLIRSINEGNIHRHKNITTLIYNKSTYNTFMDDLILYRNVIIIMTSNENKSIIDALDPCYLREGRIQGSYSMNEALS
jgi:hypothetical protein